MCQHAVGACWHCLGFLGGQGLLFNHCVLAWTLLYRFGWELMFLDESGSCLGAHPSTGLLQNLALAVQVLRLCPQRGTTEVEIPS